MHPLCLKIPHLRWAKRGFIHIICLVILCLCDAQNASCETIWVESETQFILSVPEFAGLPLSIQIVDDLMQPLPSAELTLKLSDIRGSVMNKSENSSEYGYIITDALKVGKYHGEISFEGSDTWRASNKDFQFTIPACPAQTSLTPTFPRHIPLGEPLEFSLSRKQCLHASADYMAAISSVSQKIHLDKDQKITNFSIPIPLDAPETLPLEIALSDNQIFEPEIIRENVVYYDQIIDSDPQAVQKWQTLKINAQIAQNMSDFPVTLAIGDSTWNAVSDAHGIVQFELPRNDNQCVEARIYRSDRWMDKGEWHGTLCFKKDYRQHAVLGIVAISMFGLAFMLIIKRRKRNTLPPPPAQIQTKPKAIPMTSQAVSHNSTELICIDADTQKLVLPNSVTITVDGKEFTPREWPFKLDQCHKISIKSSAHMTWNGNIKPHYQNTIMLISRRHYMTQCFESVCRRHNLPTEWGLITPNQLCETLEQKFKKEQAKKEVREFCTIISNAAFDLNSISDSQLDTAHTLAKKLSR